MEMCVRVCVCVCVDLTSLWYFDTDFDIPVYRVLQYSII